MENEMRDAMNRMSQKRRTAMSPVLGMPYDLTPLSEEDARKIFEKFRAGFPGLAEWIEKQNMIQIAPGCFVHPQTARDIITDQEPQTVDILKQTPLQQELAAFDEIKALPPYIDE